MIKQNRTCGNCVHVSYIGPSDDHACRRFPPVVVLESATLWKSPNWDHEEIDFRHTGKLPIVTSGEKACGEWKEKPGGSSDH